MKIVYGYPYFSSDAYGDVEKLTLDYIKRIEIPDVLIKPVCLSMNPPSNCLKFNELDKLWKRGDSKLLNFYENLLKHIEGSDVFINSVGINLHPEFVESLPMLTVFQCNDDPESSDFLSKPVAASYDMCLVGNIAEIDSYKSWGAKNVFWRPIGLQPEIYSTDITEDEILNGSRDIDLFMMIDKNYPARVGRLNQLEKHFPQAHFYGAGWKKGFLPSKDQLSFLRRAKIGTNIHNSTGPINYRTFYLPANGILQVCDNKSHLGKIYDLDREVVGFDTIEECIDKCRYYLSHDRERREIALAGWKRVLKDYNENTIFNNDVIRFRNAIGNKNNYKVNSEILIQARGRSKGELYAFVQDFPQHIKKLLSFYLRARSKLKKIILKLSRG